MRKLVYNIYDSHGHYLKTVSTFKEKQEAIANRYIIKESFEELSEYSEEEKKRFRQHREK